MPQVEPSLYALDPAMPVLLRPDGAVQVGWDPRKAVLVRPPCGLTAAELAALLRSMRSPTPIAELQRQAGGRGSTDPDGVANLVTQLVGAGVATRGCRPSRGRAASIRVHGRGPLSDLLVEALRCSGARIAHSSQSHAAVTSAVDLVVLSDYLVADPRMVRDLHSRGVPHLPVRVRDGTGLVGPLVIPGVTSCLACADLHRSDRDAAWPAIAAQLRDTIGVADRATLLATAALALSQVNRVIAAVRGQEPVPDPGPPSALNATLEFDLGAGSIVARQWTRHPLCSC
ncbi:cyclodehydratase [Mycobacterium haemophilum]|uniref:Cyclodehydratase n=1 Tax=Mycobacterium haemophilum TaxID=29311 RepID=A0A0I9UUX0_9MYCO|nr:cyclodehydratase [Mycobacterium haemophilum]AKN17883.1 cyclodehydratase [Mycobacterium haemophilum DSM 44634]KLO33539.1 cyclodehydratase [Mycobacterium haemophilum]KLO39066.1 cyclodehydratase [Mycobacterium haemophilum]KLO45480.1 cyclodehydratase [Mycobacterium haemophilum]KLO56632.1 cyclodehydratase [Mycobacterium haemophilum]